MKDTRRLNIIYLGAGLIMTEKNNFSLQQRFKSFGYAIVGIFTLIKEQQNAWVHLLVTVFVVAAGVVFHVTAGQWIAIVFAIVLVWMAEALNTAIELVCDLVSPDYHPLVKKAKDIAAGAVLVTAIGAVIVGLIIFLPYLF